MGMRRRNFLALSTLAVAAISGCVEGPGEVDEHQPDVSVIEFAGEYIALTDQEEIDRGIDGETILASAIEACPPGGIVHGNATVEMTDGPIHLDAGKTLSGTLTLENKLAERPCVIVQGTHEETHQLLDDSERGDTSVTISDVSSIDPLDTVVIERDEEFYSESEGNRGEIHQVKEVDEESGQITFYQPLYFDYPVEDNARAEHLVPTSAHIDGLTIEGTGSENDQHGIMIRRARDSVVRNVEINRCGTRAIRIVESLNVHVRDSTITRSDRPGIGYGVVFNNGVANCTVSNCVITECRHCVAHVSGPAWFGAPRKTVVEENYFVSGKEQPIDAHPNVISTTWRNNEVHTHTQAFLTGALVTEITDNVVYGGNALADRGNNSAMSLVVDGNRFVDSGTFHLYNLARVNRLIIANNHWENATRDPIYVEVACGNVQIVNNNITYAGLSSAEREYAIQFTRPVQHGLIEGNEIYGPWVDVFAGSEQSDVTVTDNSLSAEQ